MSLWDRVHFDPEDILCLLSSRRLKHKQTKDHFSFCAFCSARKEDLNRISFYKSREKLSLKEQIKGLKMMVSNGLVCFWRLVSIMWQHVTWCKKQWLQCRFLYFILMKTLNVGLFWMILTASAEFILLFSLCRKRWTRKLLSWASMDIPSKLQKSRRTGTHLPL